ncbi:MAG: DUF1109 family protein [Acidobacteria bacterium]|nr:DUF1109 family protein [Acidobacteriota bacterium]
MDTDHLIRTLADRVELVTPLPRPSRRAVAWTAAGAAYLFVLVAVVSPRDDLDARVRDPWFVLEQAAALVTGVTAALAAFASVVPGSRRGVVAWPVAAGAVWIALVAAGAVGELDRGAAASLLMQADWSCVWTVLAGASVPAAMMATMLRRGVPLTPHITAALGGLAAAGLGNLGICLFHAHSSSLVLLVWHCGTVVATAALAAAAGGHILRWPARRML